VDKSRFLPCEGVHVSCVMLASEISSVLVFAVAVAVGAVKLGVGVHVSAAAAAAEGSACGHRERVPMKVGM